VGARRDGSLVVTLNRRRTRRRDSDRWVRHFFGAGWLSTWPVGGGSAGCLRGPGKHEGRGPFSGSAASRSHWLLVSHAMDLEAAGASRG
jgi:hypothetical protein